MPPPITNWKELAREAVNYLFKQYVADEMLSFVRNQSNLATFTLHVAQARDRREALLTIIDGM